MKRFIVMPEDDRYFEVDANTYKDAYCLVCACIAFDTRTIVMDARTGETKIFTRDPGVGLGNLIHITWHKPKSNKWLIGRMVIK